MAHVVEVNDLDALADYRLLWSALLGQTRRASFFQSLDWLEVYWRHFGAGQRLRVLIVYSDNQPIGILPLVVRREPTRLGAMRVLTYPLHDWGSFFGPIGGNPTATLLAGLGHVRRTKADWDLVELRWINDAQADRGRTPLAMQMRGFTPVAGRATDCAQINLAGGWEAYWASRKSHWRTNVRRSERGLAEHGEVTYLRYRPHGATYGDADPRWDLYQTSESLAQESWQGSSSTGTTLSHGAIRDFLRDVHETATRVGSADVNLLYVDGRPVAFNYAYCYHGYVFGLRMGHCPNVDGAGTVLLARMIQDSFERGDHTFDLGAEYLECKRYWWTHLEPSGRYTYFPPTDPRAPAHSSQAPALGLDDRLSVSAPLNPAGRRGTLWARRPEISGCAGIRVCCDCAALRPLPGCYSAGRPLRILPGPTCAIRSTGSRGPMINIRSWNRAFMAGDPLCNPAEVRKTVHLDHLPGSFFGPPNLVDLLRHRALHQRHDRAFTYLVDGETEEVTLTYAELDRKAQAIGAWLQSMNLAGERALLLYPAGLDFIVAFFGCLYAGVVAVPAYPPRRNRSMSRVQSIVDDAQAKVALTTAQVHERVQLVLDQTPNLKKLTWLATDQVPDDTASGWKMPDVHGDTLAFLQYTSGSTGTPKGVMLNHANLIHNSAMISFAFEHTRSGSSVFWLPSYHDMGLIGGILQPLYIGQANVFLSPMSFLQKPLRWLRAISRYRCTISGGPNFAYDLCVRKITPEDRDTLDLSRWQLAFNGAEPVLAETIDKFTRMFEPCGFRREAFYPCYGMAEATLIISGGFKSEPPVVRTFDGKALENNQAVDALPDEEGVRELVGSGGNLLDQRIVIADPEKMVTLPADQIGEIWVAGPSVAQGYWQRPDATEHTFHAYLKDTGEGPFLRTGDLGFLRDSELFITGRLKDLIIIRGLNHYPQDIELTVGKSHSRLRPGNGAAVTLEAAGRERLVIVYEVERRQQRELDPVFEAIRREVAAEHELVVDAIVLIKAGSVPKTSSGKIQRHACKQGFLDGTLEVVAQWRSWGGEVTTGSAADKIDAELAVTGSLQELGRRDRNGAAARAAETASDRPRSTAEVVLEHVKRIAKERAVGMTLDTSIVELGLDSLERMEIVASLEETFGGRFPEEVLPQIESCREVAAAVDAYLGKSVQKKQQRVPIQEIPSEHFTIAEFPELRRLKQTLDATAAAGCMNPYFKVHEQIIKDTTIVGGRELVSYSSFNYVGMSGDLRVAAAAKAAIDKFGTSVSASRLVSGEKTIHREFEQAIAEFLGQEAAIVYPSGHGTNETTLGHLFGPGDLILHDALAHNSIVQGATLSGARKRSFPHNDWQSLDRLLAELRPTYRRVAIAIEGAYSMDGDIADLPRFVEVKNHHKAILYVDEAHSLAVLGSTGRGVTEHFGVDPTEVDISMGTISKGLGSCGGYIAASRALVEYLKYTSPGFVFATGISPAAVAAALAALELLNAEPQRLVTLHERANLFLSLAKERGLNTGLSSGTPIMPIILGNSLHAMQASQAMFERGINVQPILNPAVEEKAARLRFFITSDHSAEQIRQTVDTLTEVLEMIDPRYVARAAV